MGDSNENVRELINRLNRAQGQIEAIKKTLEQGGTGDYLRTVQLLKAATNALKKFGEAYVGQHLQGYANEKMEWRQWRRAAVRRRRARSPE